MASTAAGTSLSASLKVIGPTIRGNAAVAERERRLSTQTVEAMKKVGLFRMCKPKAFGGPNWTRSQPCVYLRKWGVSPPPRPRTS